MPQALPQIVAEKMKELYLNFERGAAVGSELPKKLEENKSRKRRRKREEREGEGDTGEWGSMGKALAAGIHLPKQLNPLDIREGQQMYHPSPHDPEHSMEEGVVVSLFVARLYSILLSLVPCIDISLQVCSSSWNLP